MSCSPRAMAQSAIAKFQNNGLRSRYFFALNPIRFAPWNGHPGNNTSFLVRGYGTVTKHDVSRDRVERGEQRPSNPLAPSQCSIQAIQRRLYRASVNLPKSVRVGFSRSNCCSYGLI